jgi:hypothetical protein
VLAVDLNIGHVVLEYGGDVNLRGNCVSVLIEGFSILA